MSTNAMFSKFQKNQFSFFRRKVFFLSNLFSLTIRGAPQNLWNFLQALNCANTVVLFIFFTTIALSYPYLGLLFFMWGLAWKERVHRWAIYHNRVIRENRETVGGNLTGDETEQLQQLVPDVTQNWCPSIIFQKNNFLFLFLCFLGYGLIL